MFLTIIFNVNSFSNMYINLALTCVAHTPELYLILCNSRQLIHIVLIIHSFTVLGYLKGLLVTVNTFRILFNKSYTNLINNKYSRLCIILLSKFAWGFHKISLLGHLKLLHLPTV